jgi:hypothetical protein
MNADGRKSAGFELSGYFLDTIPATGSALEIPAGFGSQKVEEVEEVRS